MMEICRLCGQGTWDPGLGACVNGDCAGPSVLAGPEPTYETLIAHTRTSLAELTRAFEKVKALREELRDTRNDVEEYELEVAAVQKALDDHRASLTRLEADYARAKAELDRLLAT